MFSKTLVMHPTTYTYLMSNLDSISSSNGKSNFISHNDMILGGCLIQKCEFTSPTINEFPKGKWIFPYSRFVKYHKEDEEWCRYFKIGYEARGFILGQIYTIDNNLLSMTLLIPEPFPQNKQEKILIKL